MADPSRLRLSPEQVGQLAALLATRGVRTLQLDTAAGSFTLRLAPGDGAPTISAGTGSTKTLMVTARTVGEFLPAHPHRPSPPKRAGEPVAAGELLGFIRIGSLLTPVTTPAETGEGGTLAAVLVSGGEPVAYGTPLFEVAAA